MRRQSLDRGREAVAKLMAITGGRGVDTAIEAVGVPASFLICEDVVAPARLITHRFTLDDIIEAYDRFSRMSTTSALKVIIDWSNAVRVIAARRCPSPVAGHLFCD